MARPATWMARLALVASLAYVNPAQAAETPRAGFVVNTEGAGLRLRSEPDPEATVLKWLGPGWRLTITGPPSADGAWLPVEHGGDHGYVAIAFVGDEPAASAVTPAPVAMPEEPPAPPAATPMPVATPVPAAAPAIETPLSPPQPGRVATTEGSLLRLRAAPSLEAEVLKMLAQDWLVTVLAETTTDQPWARVEHAGIIGYAAAEYIALGAAPAPVPTPESAAPIPSTPTPAPRPATSTPEPTPLDEPRAGWVANTDGVVLRLRTDPSVEAEIIKTLGPGWQVTLLTEPVASSDGTSWVRLEHGGSLGFAAAAYIAGTAPGGGEAAPAPPPRVEPAAEPVTVSQRSAPRATPTPPPIPTRTPTPTAAPVIRSTTPGRLMTLESARFRTAPDTSATIIATLAPGTTVEATGQETQAGDLRWLSVRALGRDGWIVASALGPALGNDVGSRLVAEALTHVGRPYVWGGDTPGVGFDCSGLVLYVVKRVTGLSLTHSVTSQVQAGRLVDRADLQPGDLVFFRDTYMPGLSHVGFYIGNNQFVSAQSESVGITVASLNSTYWGSRYHSARRLN